MKRYAVLLMATVVSGEMTACDSPRGTSPSSGDGTAENGAARDASLPDGLPPLSQARNVCSGGNALAIVVRSLPGALPFPEDGSLLVLDRNCQFWVRGYYGEPLDPQGWAKMRTGKLSEAEMIRLLEQLRFSRWSELHGEHRGDAKNGSPTGSVGGDPQIAAMPGSGGGRQGESGLRRWPAPL